VNVYISMVEAIWIAVNGAVIILTIGALIDAFLDWRDLRGYAGNGLRQARKIVARSNIRREFFRLMAQLFLLLLVVPALSSDREIEIDFFIAALLAVPFLILCNTLGDAWDRHALRRAVPREGDVK
jgi:hypothetical protein